VSGGQFGDAGDGRAGPAVLTLSPDTRSVVQARRGARDVLTSWDAEVFEWPVSQLLTELATNVVLHAGTPFEVALSLHGDRLRCEVSDTSPRPPRIRHYSAEASTGRGMHMVEQLSASWGVIRRPGGKTVWFELDAAIGDRDAEPDLDSFLDAADAGGPDFASWTGRQDGVLKGTRGPTHSPMRPANGRPAA
jgi:anti-sigma regulatory factor (Ser/Thr protein kinase)